MKKQDFIGELLEYGTGFALSVLIVIGLALAMIGFLIVVAMAAFVERVLH